MVAKAGDTHVSTGNSGAVSNGTAESTRGARAAIRHALRASRLSAGTVVLAAIVAPAGIQVAQAQDAAEVPLGEIVVTGTRIVRDGYEAPTPLTVVGGEQVQQQATPNLIDYLTTLPSFAGNYTPQSSTQNVSSGAAGTSSVNLRNLGTNRTLVLIDGQRSVPSTVTGLVDVNTVPSQLIERVEVVTGGASAAYGSDAVGGVVNFILDKDFTGLKSEVSGGTTSYGDNDNYKVAVTAGTPFADGRGHVIISGEYKDQDGILWGDRGWNKKGWQIINNPNYTATNGQPRRLLLPQIAPQNATPGGIIVSGPLRGTAFGEGGVPYQFNYGPLISGSAMQGGDWRDTSLHEVGQSIEPKLSSENLFARVSYELTDDVEAYVQANWYSNDNFSHAYPNDGFFGGLIVSVANPFLPDATRQAAYAAGLTDADELELGTSLRDIGPVQIDTSREVMRMVAGLNGAFDAFGTRWTWDAYYQHGVSKGVERALNSLHFGKWDQAIDAVRDPDTGEIVCADQSNGCVPFNPFGIGVNSAAAIDYVAGQISRRNQRFEQNVAAASIQGSPFSSWAGPVSIATGLEHRREEVSGWSTPDDLAGFFFASNYRPTFGKYDVTEGFLETVVPLAADQAWARSLDLNAAVRFTDYSTSGSVETWKVGLVYTPIDDVRVRVTRSRDIRAPNMSELFNAGTRVNQNVVDQATGNTVATENITTGNRDLKPEIADSLGVGIVWQPAFVPGLSASVDYWEIDVSDAIGNPRDQQIVDLCFQGNQVFCQAINNGAPLFEAQGGDRNILNIKPFNLAQQLVRGLDLEASYRLPMPVLGGNVGIRALATRYLENYRNDRLSLPTDTAGENYGNGPAEWRWSTSISYDRDPLSASLTARGVSSGVYGNAFIECSSNCPESTIDHPTINNNHIAGAVYLDMALGYKLLLANDLEMNLFLNVRNLTNKDPVIAVGGPGGIPFDTVSTNAANYDTHGRIYRAGVRFNF